MVFFAIFAGDVIRLECKYHKHNGTIFFKPFLFAETKLVVFSWNAQEKPRVFGRNLITQDDIAQVHKLRTWSLKRHQIQRLQLLVLLQFPKIEF